MVDAKQRSEGNTVVYLLRNAKEVEINQTTHQFTDGNQDFVYMLVHAEDTSPSLCEKLS